MAVLHNFVQPFSTICAINWDLLTLLLERLISNLHGDTDRE